MKSASRLLITGGTGSFGSSVLKKYIDNKNIEEIRILSRDEKKQNDLRLKYENPKVKFFIGDVRNQDSIEQAINGVDLIFHAAALKQVPSCEFFPMESVKTNIIGTHNVIRVAKRCNVKKIICLSTDKAAYPINAMGTSKAMMEKIAIAESRDSNTEICLTRYGNVMASRGSVIPLFFEQSINNKPLTVTNPNMTRFMMTLDDAVELVEYAFNNGKNGDLFIMKSPAATIKTLAESIIELTKSKSKISLIGTRHSEKLYEVLCTSEEMNKAIDEGKYFRIPSDNRSLNYTKYFSEGIITKNNLNDYNSHNTERLDINGTINLLRKLNLFK